MVSTAPGLARTKVRNDSERDLEQIGVGGGADRRRSRRPRQQGHLAEIGAFFKTGDLLLTRIDADDDGAAHDDEHRPAGFALSHDHFAGGEQSRARRARQLRQHGVVERRENLDAAKHALDR